MTSVGGYGYHFNFINWHPNYTAALNEENKKLPFGFKSIRQTPESFLIYAKLHNCKWQGGLEPKYLHS